jgi:hypothetical protein
MENNSVVRDKWLTKRMPSLFNLSSLRLCALARDSKESEHTEVTL